MKRSTLIGIFVLLLSLSFLFAASGVRAETKETQKGLAAVLNLKAASPISQKTDSESEMVRQARALKQVCVSLSQGLDAFLDMKSPYQDEIKTRNRREDIRAVIGFHFMMQ